MGGFDEFLKDLQQQNMNICMQEGDKGVVDNTDYLQIAQQITNIDIYNQLYEKMNNFKVIYHIFMNEAHKSQTLLFVACEMLSKKLLNHELIQNNDDFETMSKQQQNNNKKKQILFQISSRLYETVQNSQKLNLPGYLTRSCLNTISLCIYAILISCQSDETTLIKYIKMMAPDFDLNNVFIKPQQNSSKLAIIVPKRTSLPFHHLYVIQVLKSLMDYTINSAYFQSHYYFRRNIYCFRGTNLAICLNYAIFSIKTIFQQNKYQGKTLQFAPSIRPVLKLFQSVIMYPFSMNLHEPEGQDEIHQNISGLHAEIYFPTYFRNLLCDTDLLVMLLNYYSRLNQQAPSLNSVREDLYLLIRVLARVLSASQYVFVGEDEKKAFRSISVTFVARILKQNKFYDSYLVLCICKINIKFMCIQNQNQMFQHKKQYFESLNQFIIQGMSLCQGKIQQGDKHPYRQLFQVLTVYVNIGAGTVLDSQSKACAHETLNIFLQDRLVNNAQNQQMMREFGFNNSQQIDCFREMFLKVVDIFKINLQVNLNTISNLDLDRLSNASITFWLHLTALLLPEHDTSVQQTILILKFLSAAIKARSIASLHYIRTLVQEILYEVKEGVSTTYLWKFIQDSQQIKFQTFLSDIIKYAMQILTQPNYVLIQNCLQLFKAMFTKLCKYRHKSFHLYFQIIQQVCKQIDKTMLVHPDYIKLRINFFNIISIIWINQRQVSFVYRIFNNVRLNLNEHIDLIHFLRYMTDITGLIQPVQSTQVYKILMELIIVDMQTLLPFYFNKPEQLHLAFSNQLFLKTFINFLFTIINDSGYRLSYDVHTDLPFRIQQLFRPYLLQVLKYDYPKKTVQTWLKFMKLNPLGKLLPFDPKLKQKNSPHYKPLLRQYFQNLHRLESLQQFYFMYDLIGDNIELMSDWWDEIMSRGLKPDINVGLVASAHIWNTLRQKQDLARLLHRIGVYDQRYWKIESGFVSESKYASWFVNNYN